jgi:hypothetical protein
MMEPTPSSNEMACELPCQDCGSHTVFIGLPQPGKRHHALWFRCSQCGAERADLNTHFGDCLDSKKPIGYGLNRSQAA